MPTQETWKEIKGFEGLYEVSDQGRVRSLDRVGARGRHFRGRILKLYKGGRGGHLGVQLNFGKTRTCLVHVLVLEAFVSPRPDGMEACHYNGDPTDNRLSNLRWCTRKENVHDALRHGTHPRGETTGSAKFTKADIPRIFWMRGEGWALRQIAAAFGVDHKTVRKVLSRETWGHVQIDAELVARAQASAQSKKHGEGHHNSKLTEQKVRRIRALAERGVANKVLACRFGVTSDEVRLIVKRKLWKHVA